jgi:hypothetical protein
LNGTWRPGIGDPTVVGWLTVAFYFIAAYGCMRAARRESGRGGVKPRRGMLFWLTLACLMVALGINKQLDLQTLIADIGRLIVQGLGDHRSRRVIQLTFILSVGLAFTGLLAVLVWDSRDELRRRGLALLGLALIIVFVIARAALFHHVNFMRAARIGGLKWIFLLELGGAALVGLGAYRIKPAEVGHGNQVNTSD